VCVAVAKFSGELGIVGFVIPELILYEINAFSTCRLGH
jgi:hypothetical protein